MLSETDLSGAPRIDQPTVLIVGGKFTIGSMVPVHDGRAVILPHAERLRASDDVFRFAGQKIPLAISANTTIAMGQCRGRAEGPM